MSHYSRPTIFRKIMTDSAKIYEGVFAVNKPQGITSAAALRELQSTFTPSKTFAPWITAEKSRLAEAQQPNKRRKWNKRAETLQLKMGHGGTLDPLATGVLVVGIGKGTKHLNKFLECTKSYDAKLVFGAATDSYDSEGKVVAKADYQHITKELVEEKLSGFQGQIMQVPPVFSALRVNGKRLYDIARSGGEIPEIKAREINVEKVELKEWMEGGSHNFSWPTTEASEEEKSASEKLLKIGEDKSKGTKRKREEGDTQATALAVGESVVVPEPVVSPEPQAKKARASPEPAMSGALPAEPSETTAPMAESCAPEDEIAPTPQVNETSHEAVQISAVETTESLPPPPAARITMTVSSGFYVRSLCHDLGRSVDSLALMTALARTRQGDFELGKNVLEWEDLSKGEEVWGPKVQQWLDEWSKKEE